MPGTAVEGAVVVVTGANRGIGLGFVEAALAAGAAKVYAGVRDLDHVTAELAATAAETIRLEVTSSADIAAAAARCTDTTVVINNAGLHAKDRLVFAADPEAARREMEVNYFAPLHMIRAFAPVLASNGGGSILNVLSVAAIAPTAFLGGYSSSKAAALYLGGIARAELVALDITVTSLIVGAVDTRMSADFDVDKAAPRDVAVAGLRAMARGEWTVDADRMAVECRARMQLDPVRYERGYASPLLGPSRRTSEPDPARPPSD